MPDLSPLALCLIRIWENLSVLIFIQFEFCNVVLKGLSKKIYPTAGADPQCWMDGWNTNFLHCTFSPIFLINVFVYYLFINHLIPY